MDTITLSSIGGIIVAVLVFLVLKRVVGLIFRIILAVVLVAAVVIGAWWWTRSTDETDNDNTRPRQTQRDRSDK